MRWPLALSVVLLLAPLAGCLGADPSGEAGPEVDEASSNASASLEAPNWSIGQHWTWSTDAEGEVTYVVTADAGSDWIVDTTNPGVAFFDARFDISTLGEIRKSDFAGSQKDTRVEFFDWPLEEDKAWTTTWDGVEREITVDEIEDDTAHLTARQNGRVAVEYTYDAERESFGQLTFLDANGTETFAMDPVGSGEDFSGTPIRWSLTEALNREGTFGAQPASFGFGFTVPENATDLWLDLAIGCPSGSYSFGFGPSATNQNEGAADYSNNGRCPANATETGVIAEDPAPDDYRGGFTGSSPQGQGSYSFLLYVRTLQKISVGEG